MASEQVKGLKDLIRSMTWDKCPYCLGSSRDLHRNSCPVAAALAADEPAPTEPALPNNVPVEWFNGNPYVRADVYIRATAAPAKEPAQKWVREKAAQEDGAMISAGRLANNYEQCPKCLNVFPCQHGLAAREASHGERD